MKKIFPAKLKESDMLQVIAPSSSAATTKKSVHNRALKVLTKDLSFAVSFSKHAYEKDILGSSSLDSRILDFNQAFSDKDIKGILCVRGGYNANTLLQYIDWNKVKENPKPICGFSDITVLANAIYAKTGVVSYVGPNFASFGAEEGVPYVVEYFKKCLFTESTFEIKPSKKCGERNIPFKKNAGFKILQNGIATGTLLGGHLSTFNLLQGTQYMPSLKESILFLETDDFGGDMAVLEFERDLQSLLQQKDSNQIAGIVFGRFKKASKITIKKLEYIIFSKKELHNIPIIANIDFGHTQPIVTLPIGGVVRIEAKNKAAKITILKH